VEAEFEATQNTETPLEFLLKSMRDTAAEPADCSSRQGGGAILSGGRLKPASIVRR
jgi:hypothetical protein